MAKWLVFSVERSYEVEGSEADAEEVRRRKARWHASVFRKLPDTPENREKMKDFKRRNRPRAAAVLALFFILLLGAPAAQAKIPDFSVANAPEIIRSSNNPKAMDFWRQLVADAKQQGRQMVEDTKKATGLKASDLKKVDWDCLFWRMAATTAKNLRRRFPGLQPPEFADAMEQTALDPEDCPDQGGPGSRGVQVYEAAINQVQAGRNGWQMVSNADDLKALAAILAAGLNAGELAPAVAPVTAPPVPIVNPRLFPDPTKHDVGGGT